MNWSMPMKNGSDRRELFRQVAREKFNGRLPPELERKLLARSTK